MQHLNDMGRRKLGGRRWGDNRVPRWGTDALITALGVGILLGLGLGELWVY